MDYREAIDVRNHFIGSARTLRQGRRVQPMVLGYEGASEGLAPSRPFSIALGLTLTDDPGRFGIAVRTTAPAPMLEEQFLPQLRREAGDNIDVLVLDHILPRQSRQQQRIRPLEIGLSVGHPDITAGTLGAFARDRATGALGIISNNHVLANVNRGLRGDLIYQPGTYDGGGVSDSIGRLERFVPVADGAEVDAAFALLDEEPDDPGDIGGRIRLSGRITRPRTDLAVSKLGRTTSFTTNRISAIDLLDVEVNYGDAVYAFDGQIEITSNYSTPFSAGGDSGSLIVSQNGDAIGLLFAGGPSADGRTDVTFVNPIDRVLDLLDVDLVA